MIYQVCSAYVDFERESGGVPNIVRQICLGLERRRQPVRLLCGNRELGRVVAAPGLYRRSEHLETEVLEQRFNPLLGPVSGIRRALGTASTTDVVHVHSGFSAFADFAMLDLHRRGIPFVYTPHGKLSPPFPPRRGISKRVWWHSVGGRAVKGATRIVLSSSSESSEFDRLGLSPDFGVVPNGWDGSQLAEVPSTRPRFWPEPYVLFLGFIDPRKQPELLVRAFAASRTRETHKLLITGPDAYGHGSVVAAEVERVGLNDRVAFTGAVHGEMKWRALLDADCLALPSLHEGLPLVACEALGAGVPLILSTGCNFPEVSRRGAGLAPRDFRVETWASALDAVCLDPSRRTAMALEAKRLGSSLEWSSVVGQWLEVYGSVAGAKGA